MELWGPLWTHSAFGSENKNGCLKRLFRGKNQIHQQLLFSINVSITMQLLHPALSSHEDASTMEFIDHISKAAPKSNITMISDHMYIALTDKQCRGFNCSNNTVCSTFSKLFKDGIIYYASCSQDDGVLRNDTVCMFEADDSIQFGKIELFIAGTAIQEETPTALIYKLPRQNNSILQQAGHP